MMCEKMSTNSGLFSPPERVRGMTRLDRSLFEKSVCVPFVEVDEQEMESTIKCLKPYLLKLKNFDSIGTVSDEKSKRIVILNPELMSTLDDIDPKGEGLCGRVKLRFKDIVIGYDNYSHKSVLDSVLPADEPSISSFSTVGHILHLNLRPHTFPFKHLIGQVLLDKVKASDLVVNKLNVIDNEFRNFQMEVLAKRSDSVSTTVKVKESFCEFEFDFAKVYWNPRLGTEHQRILDKLAQGVDVLYDVFAGVGPFAIPAAKRRKCQVLANDLNPDCYQWLEQNRKLNKVESLVTAYNMDGRHFIRTVVRDHLLDRIYNFDGTELTRRYHIVMNLPALAIEFLDAFDGLLYTSSPLPSIDYKIVPIIHCYCFVKDESKDPKSVVKQMVEQVLDHELTQIDEIANIRKVAPNKDMFRISFSIPVPVLYRKSNCFKRQKTE